MRKGCEIDAEVAARRDGEICVREAEVLAGSQPFGWVAGWLWPAVRLG